MTLTVNVNLNELGVVVAELGRWTEAETWATNKHSNMPSWPLLVCQLPGLWDHRRCTQSTSARFQKPQPVTWSKHQYVKIIDGAKRSLQAKGQVTKMFGFLSWNVVSSLEFKEKHTTRFPPLSQCELKWQSIASKPAWTLSGLPLKPSEPQKMHSPRPVTLCTPWKQQRLHQNAGYGFSSHCHPWLQSRTWQDSIAK